MYVKTKISQGYQVVVPAEIRKNLKLKPGDFVRWKTTKNGIIIEPLKDIKFEDIYGIIDDHDKLNAVQIKKHIQEGEKY
jgi:AbrB family looped-hinge helix DNA binding protein